MRLKYMKVQFVGYNSHGIKLGNHWILKGDVGLF